MSCSKKRIISLIVSLLMIISLVGVVPIKNGVRAAQGEVNPTLNSITLSPATIEKGENAKLKVTLNVNNIPTGITYVFIKATPLFGKKVENVYLTSEPFEVPEYGNTVEAYIPIDPTVLSGEYQIYSVEIGDESNHTSTYRAHMYGLNGGKPNEGDIGTVIEDCDTFVSSNIFDSKDSSISIPSPKFEVKGEDIVVYEPELTDIEMVTTSVNAPGSIKLKLKVSDSDPYINGYSVDCFYLNDRVDTGIDTYNITEMATPTNGEYIVELKLDEYAHPGEYQIFRVILYDSEGAEREYSMDSPLIIGKDYADANVGTYFETTGLFVPGLLKDYCSSFTAPKFTVTGGTEGDLYTKLESVAVESAAVNRPGVARVKLQVEDTVGVKDVQVQFTALQGASIGEETFAGYVDGLDVKDGEISVDIPIDETRYLGRYQPQFIVLTNKRGVSTTYRTEGLWRNVDKDEYSAKYSGTYDEGTRTFITDTLKWGDKRIKVPSLTLADVDDYYFRASVQNPMLSSLISGTPEGETVGVHIDDSSNGVLPKEVFDAIKGRDIYLIAYKDSYQWVFYGKDITSETKDVNLFITVEQVDKDVYGITEDAVKVGFYPNGVLPGKAMIRLKSDYLYNLKGIKGNLYLYYNNNGVLEIQDDPAFDLTLDGSDKWCNFDITHNSEYVISGSEIKILKQSSVSENSNKNSNENSNKNSNVNNNGNSSENGTAKETGNGSGKESGSDKSSDVSKPKYSNEWIKGKWYSGDGTQTYEGTLEWKSNSTGWWVEDTAGWYPQDQWQKIDGVWYYFTPSGYMASGEYYNGYWFNSDGSWDEQYFLTWKSNSTGWWVEDKSGWWPSSAWLKIDGSWYYFNSSGYMVTSQYIDGYWIGADGVCN